MYQSISALVFTLVKAIAREIIKYFIRQTLIGQRENTRLESHHLQSPHCYVGLLSGQKLNHIA